MSVSTVASCQRQHGPQKPHSSPSCETGDGTHLLLRDLDLKPAEITQVCPLLLVHQLLAPRQLIELPLDVLALNRLLTARTPNSRCPKRQSRPGQLVSAAAARRQPGGQSALRTLLRVRQAACEEIGRNAVAPRTW